MAHAKERNPLTALKAYVEQHPTQRHAASALGISQAYLSDMLLARRSVGPRVLGKLGLKRVIVAATLLLSVLCASPVQSQSLDTATKALTVSYLALNATNVIQMEHARSQGAQLRELNPLYAPIINHRALYVAARIGSSVGIAVSQTSMRKDHPRVAFLLAVGLNAVLSYAVTRTAKEMQR